MGPLMPHSVLRPQPCASGPGRCCQVSSLGLQPALGQQGQRRQGSEVVCAVIVAALGKVVILCAPALPSTPPLVCPGHLQQGTERWSLGPSNLMLSPSAPGHSKA